MHLVVTMMDRYPLDSVEYFDPKTNQWEYTTSIPKAKISLWNCPNLILLKLFLILKIHFITRKLII